jgi:hypothetical protein
VRFLLLIQRIATRPLAPRDTMSQVVIPAKSTVGGREPGSRQLPREAGNQTLKDVNGLHWIPDLAPRSGARPE